DSPGNVVSKVGHHGIAFARPQPRERRHEAASVLEHSPRLLRRSALRDAEERWRAIATGSILTMTTRAVGGVDLRAGARRVRGRYGDRLAHARDPRDIAGVHEERRRLRVDGRAAPLPAAVEARQDDGALLT